MKERYIENIIMDFHGAPLPDAKNRMMKVPLDSQKILAITGARRAGKTAYCLTLIRHLLKKGKPLQEILYINFEDERLDQTTVPVGPQFPACYNGLRKERVKVSVPVGPQFPACYNHEG